VDSQWDETCCLDCLVVVCWEDSHNRSFVSAAGVLQPAQCVKCISLCRFTQVMASMAARRWWPRHVNTAKQHCAILTTLSRLESSSYSPVQFCPPSLQPWIPSMSPPSPWIKSFGELPHCSTVPPTTWIYHRLYLCLQRLSRLVKVRCKQLLVLLVLISRKLA